MTRKYPRLPTGPSAVGSAGVRALQTTGGDWQYKQINSDTKSYQQGDFTKVIVSGEPEYFVAGLGASGAVKIKDTQGVRRPFLPSITRSFGAAQFGGEFMFVRYVSLTTDSASPGITYAANPIQVVNPLDPEGPLLPSTSTVTAVATSATYQIVSARYKGSSKVAATVQADQLTWYSAYLTGVGWPLVLGVGLEYLEPTVSGDGKTRNEAFCLYTRFNGRASSDGRPMADLMLTRVYRSEAAITRTLSLAAGPGEIAPRVLPFVTDNAAFAMTVQHDVMYGGDPRTATITAYARFILRVFPGKDMTSDAHVDVSDGGFFAYPTVPFGEASPAGTTTPGVALFEDAVYMVCLRADTVLRDMKYVVLPNDEVLLFYEVTHLQRSAFTAFPRSAPWRQNRISRLTYAGGAATVSLVWEGPLAYLGQKSSGDAAVNPPARDPLPAVQQAVYLGHATVLAKRPQGHPYPATWDQWWRLYPAEIDAYNGHDLVMMRSTDSGTTWVEFAPLGFTNNGQNQCFGEMVVHKAKTEDAPGKVLITAWNSAKAGYYLYESEDDGSTWTERAKVAKAGFSRMDSWHYGDGGGNYGDLQPHVTLLRPLDISLPNRFKKD